MPKYYLIMLLSSLLSYQEVSFATTSFEKNFDSLKKRIIAVQTKSNPYTQPCLGIRQNKQTVLTHESCIKGINELEVSLLDHQIKEKVKVKSFDGLIQGSNLLYQLTLDWQQNETEMQPTISLAKPESKSQFYFVYYLDDVLQYRQAKVKEINSESIITEPEDFDLDGIDWEIPNTGFLFNEHGQVVGYLESITNYKHIFARTILQPVPSAQIEAFLIADKQRPADYGFLFNFGNIAYYNFGEKTKNSHLQFLASAGWHYNNQYQISAGINIFDGSYKFATTFPLYTGKFNVFGKLATKQMFLLNQHDEVRKRWMAEYGIGINKGGFGLSFTILPQVQGYSVGL